MWCYIYLLHTNNAVSAPSYSNTTLVAYDQCTFQLSLNKMDSPKYLLCSYAANALLLLEAQEMHCGNASILLTCTLILLTNSIFAGPFPTYPVQWHTNLFQGRTHIHTHIPLSLPSRQMFSLTLNFITTTRGKWTAQPNSWQHPTLMLTLRHVFTHMLLGLMYFSCSGTHIV